MFIHTKRTYTEYEIMVFGEGILETDDWFANGKSWIWSKVKSWETGRCWCSICYNITYHLKFKKTVQIMKKLEHLLYQNESVKRVFTPPPIISYRNARKLSSYLIRANLYPLERKRGSYKCGNVRCLICSNIEETDTFTSTVSGESFKINHHLCCNDKCLIYLLTSKICKKQYTE